MEKAFNYYQIANTTFGSVSSICDDTTHYATTLTYWFAWNRLNNPAFLKLNSQRLKAMEPLPSDILSTQELWGTCLILESQSISCCACSWVWFFSPDNILGPSTRILWDCSFQQANNFFLPSWLVFSNAVKHAKACKGYVWLKLQDSCLSRC